MRSGDVTSFITKINGWGGYFGNNFVTGWNEYTWNVTHLNGKGSDQVNCVGLFYTIRNTKSTFTHHIIKGGACIVAKNFKFPGSTRGWITTHDDAPDDAVLLEGIGGSDGGICTGEGGPLYPG